MYSTFGTYFDGISSKPQKVELFLNEISGEIKIVDSATNSFFWSIEQIIFEKNIIQFKNNSFQQIKIEDEEFIEKLNVLLQKTGNVGWYKKLINLGFKIHILISLLILGIVVFAYLVVIPWVAEQAVVLIPEEYDNKIGNTFYNEYADYNLIDTSKTKALNQFAQNLQLNNTKPLKFTVVNSSTINAFALPNGNVIVYTGLIDLMQNHDELAGLIGHEVSHINNRHSMKMLCRNLSGYLLISVVFTDVNGIMAVISDNIHNLQSLSYSRQFEKQADFEGVDLMIKNNINPKGMTNLFKRIQKNDIFLLPEFLSSHPITQDRIDYINDLIIEKPHHTFNNHKLEKLFTEIKN